MRRPGPRPEPSDTHGSGQRIHGSVGANDLFRSIGLRSGERVLDVAYGTSTTSSLPFDDASFDTVLCRHGLQLVRDRSGALSGMRRVLVPSGRVGVSVLGRIERSPAFAVLADSLNRHAGVRVAAAVHWLFSLSEPDDLRALMAEAGFDAGCTPCGTRT